MTENILVINHAAEHREQIKSMISALGVTPPGWMAGPMAGSPVG